MNQTLIEHSLGFKDSISYVGNDCTCPDGPIATFVLPFLCFFDDIKRENICQTCYFTGPLNAGNLEFCFSEKLTRDFGR